MSPVTFCFFLAGLENIPETADTTDEKKALIALK